MFSADFREKNSHVVAVEETTPADFGDFLACLYNADLAIHGKRRDERATM